MKRISSSVRARAAGVLGAGVLLAIAVPLSASAHVTVSPYGAAAGSFALLTFTVPNESATAATVKIEIDIPEATPFPEVSYVPLPGWTVELVTAPLDKPVKFDGNEITDAVTKVIWSADEGSELADGQLGLFHLSVGPVPDTGHIVLPAIQTYSDGSVVKWDETSHDAENPAPVLYVNDPPVLSQDADAEVTAGTEAEHPLGEASVSPVDPLARGLGIGGLVLGVLGVVFGIAARRKTAD
jgi:uncharacterized protein YcnI